MKEPKKGIEFRCPVQKRFISYLDAPISSFHSWFRLFYWPRKQTGSLAGGLLILIVREAP